MYLVALAFWTGLDLAELFQQLIKNIENMLLLQFKRVQDGGYVRPSILMSVLTSYMRHACKIMTTVASNSEINLGKNESNRI